MNTDRPQWVKEMHDRASETMRVAGSELLDTAKDICRAESRTNDDGIVFIPIIVLAAVHRPSESLIASMCNFSVESSSDSVARLLHLTADHLEGKTHDGQFVTEKGIAS
ncbi:hypothetical protein V3589_14885 [Sinorhizobium fredii]|uniref:hypothetical protein n=1 Tax=Rhizobium fredii TaxID=380 RepID=UPI003095ABC1